MATLSYGSLPYIQSTEGLLDVVFSALDGRHQHHGGGGGTGRVRWTRLDPPPGGATISLGSCNANVDEIYIFWVNELTVYVVATCV